MHVRVGHARRMFGEQCWDFPEVLAECSLKLVKLESAQRTFGEHAWEFSRLLADCSVSTLGNSQDCSPNRRAILRFPRRGFVENLKSACRMLVVNVRRARSKNLKSARWDERQAILSIPEIARQRVLAEDSARGASPTRISTKRT